jgi:hypothetical protein
MDLLGPPAQDPEDRGVGLLEPYEEAAASAAKQREDGSAHAVANPLGQLATIPFPESDAVCDQLENGLSPARAGRPPPDTPEGKPRSLTSENLSRTFSNNQFGVVPEHAERFPVEEGNDHIVLAFFRCGQWWETAEAAAKPPVSPPRPATEDDWRSYWDWIESAKEQGGMPSVLEERDRRGSFVITAGTNDKIIRLPKLQLSGEIQCAWAQFQFFAIEKGCRMSVTPVTGTESNLIALWRKDKPFWQKWGHINILAVPIANNLDENKVTAAGADFQMAVSTVKVEWHELVTAFAIGLVVLLMQTLASYLVYVNSQSVDLNDVAKSIEGGFISFVDHRKCATAFVCAEEFKAHQQSYDLEIHDLFHGSDGPGLCLTVAGYRNAVINIVIGTFIIQILVIRDAHMFWTLAPFNLATHVHLDWARWIGFAILLLVMQLNYGYIVIACFYGILGAAEDFASLLGACTTAFVPAPGKSPHPSLYPLCFFVCLSLGFFVSVSLSLCPSLSLSLSLSLVYTTISRSRYCWRSMTWCTSSQLRDSFGRSTQPALAPPRSTPLVFIDAICSFDGAIAVSSGRPAGTYWSKLATVRGSAWLSHPRRSYCAQWCLVHGCRCSCTRFGTRTASFTILVARTSSSRNECLF